MRVLSIFALLFPVLFPTVSFARSERIMNPVQGPYEFISGLGEARDGHRHQGVDLAAETGTPVVAAFDGVVIKAGKGGRAGWAVWIESENGTKTFYAHLNNRPLVSAGEEVSRGTQIGQVGESGNATTPHLHFEIHAGGEILDPAIYLGL